MENCVICKEEIEPISEETLIIHMRSGDIFANCPHPKYIPPPLSFYNNILDENNYKDVLICTENSRNPCLGYLIVHKLYFDLTVMNEENFLKSNLE